MSRTGIGWWGCCWGDYSIGSAKDEAGGDVGVSGPWRYLPGQMVRVLPGESLPTGAGPYPVQAVEPAEDGWAYRLPFYPDVLWRAAELEPAAEPVSELAQLLPWQPSGPPADSPAAIAADARQLIAGYYGLPPETQLRRVAELVERMARQMADASL